MYKTKRAENQKFKQQNEILTQPTLVQKYLFSQKIKIIERKDFKKWRLHLNTQK